MNTSSGTVITIRTVINAPAGYIWTLFTEPEHIQLWNKASDNWHTPYAQNELHKGGRFVYRMESTDGRNGFDFSGTYQNIEPEKMLQYTLDDGRKAEVTFEKINGKTVVTQSFVAEDSSSLEIQEKGWKAILENFRKYSESSWQKARRETLHFSILINASAEKVYNTMLDENSYRQWTAAFSSGSYYEGSWEKGSKILFLGPDRNGIIGRIRENFPGNFVSIQYLGIVNQGKEITSGPDAEEWAGGLENYSFSAADGKTLVTVDTDVTKAFSDSFIQKWPQALERLRLLCEKKELKKG